MLLLLRKLEPSLSESEKRVSAYIQAHPAETCLLSVHRLAEASGSSVATISRLTKKLGLSGFQELKVSLAGAQSAAASSADRFEDIDGSMSVAGIIDQLTFRAKASIEETAALLQADAVEQAVQALLGAGKIAFYGVGSSSHVAADAAYKWMRLNQWCFAHSDLQLMLTSAALLGPRDVCVAISYSGATKEILRAVETAKESGATIAAVTQVGHTPLAKLADITLPVTSMEAGNKRGDIGSRIGMFHVVDILYIAVASRTLRESASHLERTHRIVQQKKGEL